MQFGLVKSRVNSELWWRKETKRAVHPRTELGLRVLVLGEARSQWHNDTGHKGPYAHMPGGIIMIIVGLREPPQAQSAFCEAVAVATTTVFFLHVGPSSGGIWVTSICILNIQTKENQVVIRQTDFTANC